MQWLICHERNRVLVGASSRDRDSLDSSKGEAQGTSCKEGKLARDSSLLHAIPPCLFPFITDDRGNYMSQVKIAAHSEPFDYSLQGTHDKIGNFGDKDDGFEVGRDGEHIFARQNRFNTNVLESEVGA